MGNLQEVTWESLKKADNNKKLDFIMGVGGKGKKYSNSEYESIFKNENIESVFIEVEQEYKKIDTNCISK